MKTFSIGGFILLALFFAVKAVIALFGVSPGLAAYLFGMTDIMNATMYVSMALAMYLIHLWIGDSFCINLRINVDRSTE